MKPVFTLDDATIISSALRLKRDSVLRARNKEITGSELYNIYNRQIEDLNNVETKVFILCDSGVK